MDSCWKQLPEILFWALIYGQMVVMLPLWMEAEALDYLVGTMGPSLGWRPVLARENPRKFLSKGMVPDTVATVLVGHPR